MTSTLVYNATLHGSTVERMRPIDYIDRAAERFGDRPAIMDGSKSHSYRDVRVQSEAIAAALFHAGVGAHDVVAAYTPNDPRVLFILCGVMRLNAVWVPLSTRRALADCIAYLNHVEATVLFYHSSIAAHTEEIRGAVPSLKLLIAIDGAAGADPSLDDLVRDSPMSVLDLPYDPNVGQPGLVAIFQTGGTTGAPKCVAWSAVAFAQSVEIVHRYFNCGEQPICLNVASFAHGALVFAFALLAAGGTHIVVDGFVPATILATIRRERVTHLLLPPAGVSALLQHPDAKTGDYSSLRCLLVGMGPMPPALLKKAFEVFGRSICTSYGQIEVGAITWLDGESVAGGVAGTHPERLASCGRPVRGVRLAIVNDDDEILPVGSIGEVVVRGRTVGKYHNDPIATRRARRNGWHHTGDMGYLDADGYLYLVDRKKDIIKTGGHTVFSAEVEECIRALSGVRDCAVVGQQDELLGEVVSAFVVSEDVKVGTDDVIQHCRSAIGRIKTPQYVTFVKDLPRTILGKVDKVSLRTQHLAQ
jgi:acyl-CoA synthetase (AMP-forming)/AMP-acid ligase II